MNPFIARPAYLHPVKRRWLAVVITPESSIECWGDDEKQANDLARLTAAAPALLAALGNLLSFCEKGYHDNTILTEARKAIAEAS